MKNLREGLILTIRISCVALTIEPVRISLWVTMHTNFLFYAVLLCHIIICISIRSKAIIFIGPFKTGSSTVAQHLYDNKEILRRKNVFVPETKCDDKKFGGGIVQHCLNSSSSAELIMSHCVITCEEFYAFLSVHRDQNHTIIFGHEGFSAHMNEQSLKSIFKMLEGYDIWIISFYRPLTARMFSYHEQTHSKDKNFQFVYFDKWYENFKLHNGAYLDTMFVTSIVSGLVSKKYSSGKYNRNDRLYLVDFNNAIKNHMEPHQVIHCDILQLCDSNIAKSKPASLKANGHKDRFGNHDQLFYNFRLFVENQSCKLLKTIDDYTDEDEYWAAFDNQHIVIPYIRITNEEVKEDALQTHKVLYGLQALYPDEVTWLYANETLSLDSINNFKYEEVNRDSLQNDKSYIDVFRDMIKIGKKRKEIEC